MSRQDGGEKKERASGIELLRMLAGMGVIVLHFNYNPAGGGALAAACGANAVVLMILENLCICAVNVFLLISGFFGSASRETKPGKLILLILETVVINVALYIGAGILNGTFDWRGLIGAFLPVNYYVILYCTMMLAAPFINRLVNSLDDKAFRRLLVICFGLFSVCASGVDAVQEITGAKFAGLNPVGLEGSGGGYTIVNFILVYLIGAGIRRNREPLRKIRTGILAAALAGCVAMLYAWRAVLPNTSWMYCNPIVILEAAILFLLFERMAFRSRVINRIAPAAFTCFLIHEAVLNRLGTDAIGTRPLPVMIGLLVLIVAGIYVASFLVMTVWNWFMKIVFRDRLDRIPAITA